MKKNNVILEYIGKQYFSNGIDYMPMWNIHNSPKRNVHPDGSSVGLESLKNIGAVSYTRYLTLKTLIFISKWLEYSVKVLAPVIERPL